MTIKQSLWHYLNEDTTNSVIVFLHIFHRTTLTLLAYWENCWVITPSHPGA